VSVVIPFLVIGLATAATDPSKEQKIEEIEQLLTNYHRAPSLEKAAKFFGLLIDEKLIDEPFFDGEQRLKLTGYSFGLIARGKPKLVRFYESKYPSASKRGRLLLLEALRVAGDQESVRKLDQWREDLGQKKLKPGQWHIGFWENDPAEKHLADAIDATRAELEAPVRPMPRDLPASTPTDLNLLWCDFLITGEYAPVSRILDVLDRPDKLRERIGEQLKRNPGSNAKLFDVLQAVNLAAGKPPALIKGDLDLEFNLVLMDPLPQPGQKAIQNFNRALGLAVDFWEQLSMKGAASSAAQSNLRQHPKLAEVLKAHVSERPEKTRTLVTSWLAKK
jgi:hypothetical protein